MKKLFPLILLTFSILLTSCGDSEEGGIEFAPIPDVLLSGTVFGESFTATGGKAFDSGDFISINITDIEATCESSVLDYNFYISTNILSGTGAGIYEGINVVFHKEGEPPFNFIGGIAEVTAITSTSVSIKISAKPSSENTIEGTFTVNYCN